MQSFLLSVGEKFVPILKDSQFKETGRLTPEEFVLAGDYLVFKCPTWCWAAGEGSKLKPYLPTEKQYLITKNVPMTLLDNPLRIQDSVDSTQEADFFESVELKESQIDEIDEMFNDISNHSHQDQESSACEDIPDIDDFNEPNLLLPHDPAQRNNSDQNQNHELTSEGILCTNTFDLCITYDKFYQTPRMWISGYSSNGEQLAPKIILDLISQDHAHKTVTVESFPHMSHDYATVHPCKHSAVMKKIIDQYIAAEREIRVDQYLIIFLKFMSSIMPTIDYDHTMTME